MDCFTMLAGLCMSFNLSLRAISAMPGKKIRRCGEVGNNDGSCTGSRPKFISLAPFEKFANSRTMVERMSRGH
jgi:hypothetical protein